VGTNDIAVSIKLKDLRKFLADAGLAEEAVDDIADKTTKSGKASAVAAQQTRKHSGAINALKVAAIAGAAALSIFAVRGAVGAVNAASNLEEQVNKATVVFRGSERAIIRWSEGTADAFGISQRQALESAGVFGNMLVPMGFARRDAAKMSRNFVELAADMASFNNADPQEVLEALRSGLSGETEPLRKFGVFLNDARIKQEALNSKLWDGTGQLSAQAKAQAISNLIYKDTKDAQGDVARTSDSLANTQRRLAAQWENIQARVGKFLLPYVAKLANRLSKFLKEMQDGTGTGGQFVAMLTGLWQNIVKVYKAGRRVVTWLNDMRNEFDDGNPKVVFATAAVIGLVAALATMKILLFVRTALIGAQAAMIAFNASLWANPIVLIVGLLIGLGVAFVIAYKKIDWFRNGVNAVWNWIKDNWPLLLGILTGPIGIAVVMIIRHWDTIKSSASDAVEWIKSAWNTLVTFFTGLPGKFTSASASIGKAMVNGIISALNSLIDGLNSVFSFEFDPPGPGKISLDAPDIPHIPQLAMGGTVTSAGRVLVGERGPEILDLGVGASVVPLTGPKIESVVGSGGLDQEIVIHTHVHLDGREIGQAVDRYNTDRMARR
jgi:hypothetical protein